jgi:hypothetical protein
MALGLRRRRAARLPPQLDACPRSRRRALPSQAAAGHRVRQVPVGHAQRLKNVASFSPLTRSPILAACRSAQKVATGVDSTARMGTRSPAAAPARMVASPSPLLHRADVEEVSGRRMRVPSAARADRDEEH